MTVTIFSSLARISDLESRDFEQQRLPQNEWAGSD
jgi:hypothetical protein